MNDQPEDLAPPATPPATGELTWLGRLRDLAAPTSIAVMLIATVIVISLAVVVWLIITSIGAFVQTLLAGLVLRT